MVRAQGDLLATYSARLDPAGDERHDDHGEHDGDLWNLAGGGDCDSENCRDGRDDHGEPDGGVPGALAEFHAPVHSSSNRRNLV